MVQYVIKVITALGIVNGAVHNEVKYNGETEVTPPRPPHPDPDPDARPNKPNTPKSTPTPSLTLTLTLTTDH